MTKFIPLIARNVLRSKRRTILTILSIAMSLFVFSVLVSIPTFATQMLADTASSVRIVCVTKMGFDYPLPEAYKVKVAATPHVVGVTSAVLFGGIYHEVSDQFPSVAMDADNLNVMFPDWGISEGGVEQFKAVKVSCLVAQGTMSRFNLHMGQQIEIRGTAFPFSLTLTIVGTIARGPAPSFLIFRRDYFEEAAGNPGIVDNFYVRVDDSQNIPEVCAALDRQFANSSSETQSRSEQEFMGSMLGRFRFFMRLAEFLGFAVVVAIGMVAANTVAMSIRERRTEIAVMQSIGFSSRLILSLLISESLIIALLGGALGCGVAFVLFKAVAVNGGALGPFVSLHVPPSVLGEAMVIAALIGLLSAFIPARIATRRPIVNALRLVD